MLCGLKTHHRHNRITQDAVNTDLNSRLHTELHTATPYDIRDKLWNEPSFVHVSVSYLLSVQKPEQQTIAAFFF